MELSLQHARGCELHSVTHEILLSNDNNRFEASGFVAKLKSTLVNKIFTLALSYEGPQRFTDKRFYLRTA